MNYWRGLIYNRKKDFSQAIRSFEMSEKRGHKAKDMYYEWAQAHYAENNFQEAIRLFDRSCAQGFKCEVSKYYQGHSNELLGMEAKAKTIYEEIMRNPGADTEIRQTAGGQSVNSLLRTFLRKARKVDLICLRNGFLNHFNTQSTSTLDQSSVKTLLVV